MAGRTPRGVTPAQRHGSSARSVTNGQPNIPLMETMLAMDEHLKLFPGAGSVADAYSKSGSMPSRYEMEQALRDDSRFQLAKDRIAFLWLGPLSGSEGGGGAFPTTAVLRETTSAADLIAPSAAAMGGGFHSGMSLRQADNDHVLALASAAGMPIVLPQQKLTPGWRTDPDKQKLQQRLLTSRYLVLGPVSQSDSTSSRQGLTTIILSGIHDERANQLVLPGDYNQYVVPTPHELGLLKDHLEGKASRGVDPYLIAKPVDWRQHDLQYQPSWDESCTKLAAVLATNPHAMELPSSAFDDGHTECIYQLLAGHVLMDVTPAAAPQLAGGLWLLQDQPNWPLVHARIQAWVGVANSPARVPARFQQAIARQLLAVRGISVAYDSSIGSRQLTPASAGQDGLVLRVNSATMA